MATPCPVRNRIGLGFDVILLTPSTHPGRYGLIDWEMFYSFLRTIIYPLIVGRFSGTTRTRPGDNGLFIPQVTISLNREHTYFSVQISDGLINPRGCFTCCIVDGGRMSVGLTPLSTRARHPTISNTPTRVCRRHSTRRMRTTHPVTHNLFPADRSISNACAPSQSLLPRIRPYGCSR
jgi:hypothetical protein